MAMVTAELLDRTFTVDALMTPYDELFTCNSGGNYSEALEVATELSFDCVPIVKNDRIVSILQKDSSQPESITDKWLVSRDTPVFHLLDLFANNGQAAFLVLHRQDIAGIVTPADLNKMPMRVYIYNVIGSLEMLLAERLRQHFETGRKSILHLIDKSRAKQIEAWMEEAAKTNVDSDIISYLYFKDLWAVIRQRSELWEDLGIAEHHFAKDGIVDGLRLLRNRTMHAVQPLVLEHRGERGLEQIRKRIRFALDVIERLSHHQVNYYRLEAGSLVCD